MILDVAFPVPLRRTFYYAEPSGPPIQPGTRVLAPFGASRRVGVAVGRLEEKDADLTGFAKLKTVEAALDPFPLLDPALMNFCRWMAARWDAPLGAALGLFTVPGKDFPLPEPASPEPAVLPPALPEGLDALADSLLDASAPPGPALLAGLRSGERDAFYANVLARASAGDAIRHGVPAPSQALLLLPDLALAASLIKRLRELLPEGALTLWHSRLTPKQRREAWTGAWSGRARIVVGTRSALFLPFRNLAFALMDSEEDDLYKQEEQEPRFHAREALLKLAELRGARAVLAGLMPSVESRARASIGGVHHAAWCTGPLRLLERPALLSDPPPPRVELVDLNAAPGVISEPMLSGLREAVAAGGKALLVVNRRGVSLREICARCGWTKRCRRCEIPMATVPGPGGAGLQFLCKGCGIKEPFNGVCPSCGGRLFRDKGVGTQKLAGAARRELPSVPVHVFDGDLVRSSLNKTMDALGEFAKPGPAILVSTRLALRGHDFPALALAGFADADYDLSPEDFRSSEEVFRMFVAAADCLAPDGPRRLIIQTRQPGHHAFERARQWDPAAFAADEEVSRRTFAYPPFVYLLRVNFSSFDRRALDAALDGMDARLEEVCGPGSQALGPVERPPAQGRKRLSAYFIVKLPPDSLAGPAGDRIRAMRLPAGVELGLEADPYTFR